MTSAENPEGMASHPLTARLARVPPFLQLVLSHAVPDDDYRQLVGQIREVARQTRLTVDLTLPIEFFTL